MTIEILETNNRVEVSGKGVAGAKGDSFKVDAQGLFADLSDYDAELAGFTYYATDTGNLYIKNSNISADWSDAIAFKGDKGDKGDDGELTAISANSVLANPTTEVAVPTAVSLDASTLLGRGSSGNVAKITLGTGLIMTENVLSSAGGGVSYDAISATADWNTLTTDGFYITSGTTYIHAPLFDLSTKGTLRVIRNEVDSTAINQIWFNADNGNIWKRSSSSSGTNWSMWKCDTDINSINASQYSFDPRKINSITSTNALVLAGGIQIAKTNTSVFAISAGTIPLATRSLLIQNSTNISSRVTIYPISLANNLDIAKATYKGGSRFEATVALTIDGYGSTFYFNMGSETRTTENTKFICYRRDQNSGNFICVTDNGGTETVTNTDVAPIITGSPSTEPTAYNKLRIEWNIQAEKVEYYIDDVLVATQTDNISPNFSHRISVDKSGGVDTSGAFIGELTSQIFSEALA